MKWIKKKGLVTNSDVFFFGFLCKDFSTKRADVYDIRFDVDVAACAIKYIWIRFYACYANANTMGVAISGFPLSASLEKYKIKILY